MRKRKVTNKSTKQGSRRYKSSRKALINKVNKEVQKVMGEIRNALDRGDYTASISENLLDETKEKPYSLVISKAVPSIMAFETFSFGGIFHLFFLQKI